MCDLCVDCDTETGKQPRGWAQDGAADHSRTTPSLEWLSCLSSHRFLRHVPVVYVDYPGPASLTQIYGTFNRAMLRLIPSLRTYAEPLTAAMVEFYTMSQVLRASLLL